MCQIAVTYLATAQTARCLGLACGESGEVVVQQEALVVAVQNVVHQFLVKLRSQCHCSQCLSLTAGEHGRAVRAWQVIGLAPDGANLVGLAAVQADMLVQDATAHCVALHIVEIAVHHQGLLFTLLFRDCLHEVVVYLLERVVAPLLVGAAGLGHCIALVVALFAQTLLNLLVVGLVAVFALGHTQLGGKFLLCHAHRLDGLVGSLQGGYQLVFAALVHFAFHHHDVVVSSTYHKFHVGVLNLLKCGVDDEFTVDAGHAHFGYRLLKRDVAHRYRCRCGQPCQCVGSIHSVAREHDDVNNRVRVVVRREQRPQHAVHKASRQHF